MVHKQWVELLNESKEFENDVKMYGTQARILNGTKWSSFENDVKMYGTQAQLEEQLAKEKFENDVKMYGTQAKALKP